VPDDTIATRRSLGARDPRIIRLIAPIIHAFADRYYRAEVEGAEHLSSHAALIVATHNGIWTFPDLVALASAFWKRFGTQTPGFGLGHRIVFLMPGLGEIARRVGGIPASEKNALAALAEDRPVLVCPGGDEDAMKPFSQRHRIHFGRRRGFIRIALLAGVPIIPVVSVGAHETLLVLNEGRRFARWLGLEKAWRVKKVPFTLSFPFGFTIAGIPSIPLPSKVRVRSLPPIDLGLPPEAASDREAVERCFERVRDAMQAALDELAVGRKRVFFG